MNLEQIRARLRTGFRPFAIHTSDGRKFTLPYPEFILVGKGIIAVLRKDGLIETVDALHIVSLEELTGRAVRA
ncbi:MAG: hypothetical protein KGS61_15535 [Verrucomicrobia bacterium]|nr:hypothetical protein [Verrucomicrobiota bacterium]